MKKKSVSVNQLTALSILALLMGLVGQVLTSAKWGIGVFAWISPFCYLFFLRFTSFRRKWIWFFLTQMAGTIIASQDVAPFPLAILILTSLIHTSKIFLVYFTNERLVRHNQHFLFTIYFP